MNDPTQILKAAKRILLVDWPRTAVPRALITAGFIVFGSSPKGYSEATLAADQPDDAENVIIFAPESEADVGYLVFRRLVGTPSTVDIVNVYRPEDELKGIVEHHVLPLGAAALWLQPPNTSALAKEIAGLHSLAFVEGIDIAEVALSLIAKNI